MKTLASLLLLFLVAALHAEIGSSSNPNNPNNNPNDLSRILRAGIDAFSGNPQQGTISLQQVTSNWNQTARAAAKQMFDKYGAPQEVTANRLVWRNNGPWKITEVVNEDVPHNFPTQHSDVLRQTLAIDVPVEKYTELAEFDGSILVDRTKGELSARCDREENNFIALNLASDVIAGKLSAQQARQQLTQLAQAVKQGQQPNYATGVQFNLPVSSKTGDPDRSADQQQNWQRIGW